VLISDYNSYAPAKSGGGK